MRAKENIYIIIISFLLFLFPSSNSFNSYNLVHPGGIQSLPVFMNKKAEERGKKRGLGIGVLACFSYISWQRKINRGLVLLECWGGGGGMWMKHTDNDHKA